MEAFCVNLFLFFALLLGLEDIQEEFGALPTNVPLGFYIVLFVLSGDGVDVVNYSIGPSDDFFDLWALGVLYAGTPENLGVVTQALY